jgi:membrane associated rhomboid family serine protease
MRENRLIADLPYLTVGMIVLLSLVFGVEKRLAFDIGKNGDLSVHSLIAFGAVSRDLVVGSGQWWRIGLAPLLHGSNSHLVGNCFALLCAGSRLEPLIGRGWFALIFVASALGGVVGSLYGNLPDLPSVGASGAITGLIGALFVVSFNPYAEPDQQRAMRKTALFFGIPALLPLAFGASGHVDYFAHAGGAIAGGALAMTLCAVWSERRPDFARPAAAAALTGLVISIICSGFTFSRYATYAADAAQLIRASELPETFKAGAERSSDLVARYPKDPRSHLLRATALAQQQRYSEAESELRTTLALASSSTIGRPIRDQAQIILAVVLLEEGRRSEAKGVAADACRAKDQLGMRGVLVKAKLCD